MTLRHLLRWRTLFYEGILPALERLGPARSDAALTGLGRLSAWGWPPRRHALTVALHRARTALRADWDMTRTPTRLAANIPRFLARDFSLDALTPEEVFARFDVRGEEFLHEALAGGRGVILLSSHLGGHLAAMHWLVRRAVPVRFLVQRPHHVSQRLQGWFDQDEGPISQSGFFLRRELGPKEAAERLLRARAALQRGMAVYLAGDIPWTGPNARPGRLLGYERSFLSVWADLAVLTRVPVLPLFCTHRPGGRFALTFDSPWTLTPGTEPAAVKCYLQRLEAEIAAHPWDAVAHLLWPCYGPPETPAVKALPPPGPHRRPIAPAAPQEHALTP